MPSSVVKESSPVENNLLWITGHKGGRSSYVHRQKASHQKRRLAKASREKEASKHAVASFRSFIAYHEPTGANPRIELPLQRSKDSQADPSGDDWVDEATRTSPQTFLTASRGDPFATWAVSEPNIESYVNEFLDVDYRVFGLLNTAKHHPARNAVQFCLSSPVTTMTIAAYAAACGDLPGSTGSESLIIRSKAIKMVNESLHLVDDYVLYAVSLLWNLEARFGDGNADGYHRNGFEQMIKQRGGWNALSPLMQNRVGWLCIALPGTLNLSDSPHHVYLQDGFHKMVAFSDAVNDLSLEPTSPYLTEASALTRFTNMHRILSDNDSSQGSSSKAYLKLHNMCRLAILLYIHALFLRHGHMPKILRKEITVLQDWLFERLLDRFTTTESFTAFIICNKDLPVGRGTSPGPLILQMIMVAKRLSPKSLDLMLRMFYGYLSGKTFSKHERLLLWDVAALEKEAFSTGYD